MDVEQERELLKWAASLTEAAEPERRAMGKAILMLRDQIESLRAELERRSAEEPPDDSEVPPANERATGEPSLDDTPTQDPTPVGLRNRLLAAGHRRSR
jgi:hypothetical protein